jgi:phospholipase/carboxylesterase
MSDLQRFPTKSVLWASGALLGAGLLTAGIVVAFAAPGAPRPTARSSVKGRRARRLSLPRAPNPGTDTDAALPMIICFTVIIREGHAGMFYETMKRPVRVILPEGPHALGSHRAWASTSSKTEDQAAYARELSNLAGQLAVFVNDIVQCRPTVGKPVVTGSSEGGHMAYLLASTHPDLVQGAVAVAGYLPQDL